MSQHTYDAMLLVPDEDRMREIEVEVTWVTEEGVEVDDMLNGIFDVKPWEGVVLHLPRPEWEFDILLLGEIREALQGAGWVVK